MKSAKEILQHHIDNYLNKHKMARFGDIPISVFIEAMELYLLQELRDLHDNSDASSPENTIGAILDSINASEATLRGESIV